MDISISGAGGAGGREIVIQIIRDRLLERREILQLVASNPESAHPFILHGFRADLQDAYAETIPELDVTDDPAELVGEVVVVAGGTTFSTDPDQVGTASRDMLARANRPVFERFAQTLGQTRHENPPIVITFLAFAHRMEMVRRVLQRLEAVRSVACYDYANDARLVKTATVQLTRWDDQVRSLLEDFELTTIPLDDGRPVVVLSGCPVEVDRAAAVLCDHSLLVHAAYSFLPPAGDSQTLQST